MGRIIWDLNPSIDKRFISSEMYRPALGPSCLLLTRNQGLSPQIKLPGYGAEHQCNG
jgi:hypothetical protein